MTRRGAARAVLAVAAGIAAGAATELALVLLAVVDPPRIVESTDVFAIRGDGVWHGSARSSALLDWVNVERAATLVNPGEASGSLPAWAEPPNADGAGGHGRHAALAVGWPLRATGMRWAVRDSTQGFPPPAEVETSGDAPKDASRRMLSAWMGGAAPAGGHGEAFVLWRNLVADALVLALPWLAAAGAIRAARGARTGGDAPEGAITPPE